MTGPEHYAKAEELARLAENADFDASPADVAVLLQFAQVHATLALAAASAGLASGVPIDGVTGRAWRAAVTA